MTGKQKYNFDGMLKKWESDFIARERVADFTGGLISPGTLANIDSDPERQGPPRVKFGRKIAYPTIPFVEWLNRKFTDLKDDAGM